MAMNITRRCIRGRTTLILFEGGDVDALVEDHLSCHYQDSILKAVSLTASSAVGEGGANDIGAS